MIVLYQDEQESVFYDGAQALVLERAQPGSEVVSRVVLRCVSSEQDVQSAIKAYKHRESLQIDFENRLRRLAASIQNNAVVVDRQTYAVPGYEVKRVLHGVLSDMETAREGVGDASDDEGEVADDAFGRSHWDEPSPYDEMDY